MDKTISISLGGFSFIVDDRAYLKLKSYLDEIRHSLHGMEGTDDIIADVETRIAELFKERLGVREVVNEHDVEHIVGIMGRPEQYMDEEEVEPKKTYSSASSSYKSTASGERVKKKLYRDPNDKIIAGVLSGLAHYLGVDTWITRVLFIVLLFSDLFISWTTVTIIGYIVLWIILPKAETASQKYEMFGQAGDFETIKKNASQAASEMKGVASDASSALGKIFHVLGKILLVFVGIMLICTGIGLIIAAISLVIATFTEIPMQFFGYILDDQWQDITSKILFVILFAIPAILLIMLGSRLISSRVKINRTFVWSSLGIWLLAVIGSGILAMSVAKNFFHEIEYTDEKSYSIPADTISVSFNEFKNDGKYKYKWFNNGNDGFAEIDGNLHLKIEKDIQIKQSDDQNVKVEILYKSKGKNMDNARQNAESIQYDYKVNANGEIELNSYIILPKGSKFRNQEVEIILYIPASKTVQTINTEDIILFNDKNEYEYEYGENKFFKFTDGKFQCTNCEHDEEHYDEDQIIHISADSDSAQVRVTREGVRIEDGKDKVIIDKKQIKISDGTDSLNIDLSGN